LQTAIFQENSIYSGYDVLQDTFKRGIFDRHFVDSFSDSVEDLKEKGL